MTMNIEHLRSPVLCAVSGGVDSMYMLCALREVGFTVYAAHFNHGLRGAEADRDEFFVQSFCEENGIPFYAGRGNVRAYAAERHLSLETAARELRYQFLETCADGCDAACVATAHTADDNAETMLFRLARGTGAHGLAGIPAVRGRFVRPLLDTTREEAEAWLAERGIAHVEDSTNASDAYARNRIRHAVVPVLKEINCAFVTNAARAAENLRRDDEYLFSLARQHLETDGDDALSLAKLPEPVAVRALMLRTGRELQEKHWQAILKIARDGGRTEVPGLRVERAAGKLFFYEGEPARLPDRLFSGTILDLPEAGLQLVKSEISEKTEKNLLNTEYRFSIEKICGTIQVTARRQGDAYRPAGRGCTKTLKQLFNGAGIPSRERDCIPVLRDDEGILAVYGFGVAERVVYTDEEPGLNIRFIKSGEDS